LPAGHVAHNGGTAINIVGGNIDEVLISEAASSLGTEVTGFGNVTAMSASSQPLISSPSE